MRKAREERRTYGASHLPMHARTHTQKSLGYESNYVRHTDAYRRCSWVLVMR
jgi:hypothetical protein